MKSLIALADGTGNGAGSLFKTNIWRLYQALDLDDHPAQALYPGEVNQLAYYHDGVGTSSFRPLALLGGVFGWGLKRNLLDLYMFLCRNYQDGDRIYAFGFSRGAFTIRLLIGLVAGEGLVHCDSDAELKRYAADAYRAYRRNFPGPRHGLGPKLQRRMVTALRDLRDVVIRWKRRREGLGVYQPKYNRSAETIAFVGVFDTVAAYGLPVAELTRGVDRWVWPLSMPNYRLSPKVRRACHALSLDDERDTFHPLLWDERAERARIAAGEVHPDRLQQVWFPGVHADVGGGYPDDAAATVPLRWMIGHAEAAGLRFRRDATSALAFGGNGASPLHDSRRGLAGYYRYQPRRLSARLDPPDPDTLIMRDPDLDDRGLLTSLKVHESAMVRVASGIEHYAPIVLPAQFDVVGADGALERRVLTAARSSAGAPDDLELVWNEVWRKRVTYFLTVGVSLLLAAMPLLPAREGACLGPACLLSPIIAAVGWFVPGFAQAWIDAFAQRPGLFLAGFAVLVGLIARGQALDRRIHDRMRTIWRPAAAATPTRRSWSDRPIYRLRRNRLYLRALQTLKWRWVPGVFGAGLVAAGALAVVFLATTLAVRTGVAIAERSGAACRDAPPPPANADAGEFRFSPDLPCARTPWRVVEGHRYRLSFAMTEDWRDATITASPLGFASADGPLYFRPASLLLRTPAGRWLQPMALIGGGPHRARAQLLPMVQPNAEHRTYVAEFTAIASGTLALTVNDVLNPFADATDQRFYRNNSGAAQVWCSGPAADPQCRGGVTPPAPAVP